MLKHLSVSIMNWLVSFRDNRDLRRLDCRYLEDIGLEPKDLTQNIDWPCHRSRHHPSWDGDIRCPKHSNCGPPT